MNDFTAGFRHDATQPFASPSPPETVPAAPPGLDALDALYRDERAGVLAYLRREVGFEHASDLAQEVFLRAATSAQLNELRNPGGFLRCIARNLVIDFARRRRRRIVTLPIAEDVDVPCSPDQEDRLLAMEAEILIKRALAALPERTAQIFAMNRFERKSYRAIHCELGIGRSTVEYHIMKALAHLREALDREDLRLPSSN